MKLQGKLLDKLVEAGLEIEEIEREVITEDERTIIVKYDIAKFPCARNFIPIKFTNEIEENIYLESTFEHFKFIKDFEGIWSPKLKIIECEIQPASRLGMPYSFLIRRLMRRLGGDIEDADKISRFEFEESENGVRVSIGDSSDEFALLSYLKDDRSRIDFSRKRPTIRIENINISKHDRAKNLLERIGNSILFKIDITTDIGLKLSEDRNIRRSYLRRRGTQYESDKKFPLYEYDNEPMSLYWYSRSAVDMPLLRFLALYQILEFYFPIFSQKDAHQQIKNLIKDPRFNPNKDSDITRILGAISQNKNQIGFGSELEQLKSTLQSCITNEDLRNLIEDDDDMLAFFKEKKSKKLADKSLSISSSSTNLVNECAERIYEIRCRVVHTKASDKSYEMLLPSSPELKNMIFDISIINMIAKKVLVATSRLLKI